MLYKCYTLQIISKKYNFFNRGMNKKDVDHIYNTMKFYQII